MGAKHFEVGARVAHSARVAYQHGSRSVAKKDSILSQDADAFFGTVVGPVHAGLETEWTVKVDAGKDGGAFAGEERGFSADSLVAIED